MYRLVESHRPQAHEVPRGPDPRRGGFQIVHGDARNLRDRVDGVVGEVAGHGVPPLGELRDELFVDVPSISDQSEQAVEQCHVGAGADGQVQVSLLRRRSKPWVDHDQFRAGFDPVHHPQEEDGVAVGHVCADDQEDVGVIEVVVATRRAVGAEGLLVARSGTGHAQPGVRLDEVRAEVALGQFVRQVLRLQGHLTRHVERDGVVAVLLTDGGEPAGRLRDGLVEAHRLAVNEGRRLTTASVEQVGGGASFGAQPAPIGGVRAGPRGREDAPGIGRPLGGEGDPAAHAAVAAHRVHRVY